AKWTSILVKDSSHEKNGGSRLEYDGNPQPRQTKGNAKGRRNLAGENNRREIGGRSAMVGARGDTSRSGMHGRRISPRKPVCGSNLLQSGQGQEARGFFQAPRVYSEGSAGRHGGDNEQP
ncbi:unnamed protein product, partial [Discosporangium mesarthrocarpum]